MSGRTIIQYYIPEDGDELEHPNVYTLEKKATGVTLSDIKSTFPIPGTYYFRFKRAFKKTWIWYDVNDLEEVVPTFEGSIMMKVTRLPASAARKMDSSSKRNNQKTEPSSAPKQTSKPTEQAKSSSTTPTEDFFGSTSPANPSPTPSNPSPSISGDIFDTFSTSPMPARPAQPAQPADPWASLGI